MTEQIVDAIAIGRNEGQRLIRCLDSLNAAQVRHIIYVDSGSTDGSVEAAQAAGAQIVKLDITQPFTAARARNAGFAALPTDEDAAELIQFIDGDCVLDPGWLPTASEFMAQNPKAAVACGRRRELAPEASIYNRLIDIEWDTPIGETGASGGDALMRRAAFEAVGGFNPDLIAGEEPELCVRLRRAGWSVWRLDAEMTRHDADMHLFSQWWKRARRAGHAYAEGAAMHGAPPERHFVAATRRALIWGLGIPLAALLGAVLIHPIFLLLLLAWPAQMLRLTLRDGDPAWAFYTVLGKLPESLGILEYWGKRLSGRRSRLIEYK